MRTLRLTSLGAVIALLVAACAAPAASPSPEATPPPATGEPTASPTPAYGSELEAAEAGAYRGTTVDILGQWIEGEAAAFEGSLQGFAERTGINIVYSGITNYETVLAVRVEGGLAPDLAQIAQPGTMRSYQAKGHLVDLTDKVDVEAIERDYIESFVDLASVDGRLYGVYYKADLKSIVWYPVAAFEEAGYEIPTTWDELIALSDRIVADGKGAPWCISIEHGDASGWVATDWLEDILLRTAPLETYDKWITNEVPFNDPAVLRAAKYMSQIWFEPGYVYGGNTAINATWVGATQTPMFDPDGPKCWMHKQAAWIPTFWPEGKVAGVDSKFFYFPEIDPQYGRPVLGGGDMFVMFQDRPEVQAVLQFLATPEAARGWIEAGGFVSPNRAVPASWYATYPSSGLAEVLAEATALRFDASDVMPKEVGAGTFWKGMVEWVAKNGAGTEEIFAAIEESWP